MSRQLHETVDEAAQHETAGEARVIAVRADHETAQRALRLGQGQDFPRMAATGSRWTRQKCV